MTRRRGFGLAFLIAVTLSTGGCEVQVASGGTGGTGSPQSGGTGGTGMVARGTVTAVSTSSVTVSGISFTTSAATVALPAGSGALQPGMVVTLHGSVAADGVSGTATDLAYLRTVIGQMLAGDATGFSVYGQAVTYHLPVTFQSADGTLMTVATAGATLPSWLSDGTPVEVSGFVQEGGTVEASYIRQLSSGALKAGDDLEFIGLVTGVDAGATPGFINVNGMRVNLPAEYVWAGAKGNYVHVHAKVPADEHATGIDATEIEIKDMALGGSDGDGGELEGIVSDLADDKSSFTLSGQQVEVVSGTTYKSEDGEHFTQGDLVNGLHVEVHGHFATGQFFADKIEFE